MSQQTPLLASRFRAQLVAAPIVHGAGIFDIPLDTVLFDDLNEYDPLTGRFTPREAGRYIFHANMRYTQAIAAGSQIYFSIYHSPITTVSENWDYPPLGSDMVAHLTAIVDMTPNEYVVVQESHAAVGNVTISNFVPGTFFMGHRLS